MNTDQLVEYFTVGSTLIDLTHPLRPGMPVWPTHPIFCHEVVESYETGDISCNHLLSMSEHTGTHFDAPSHFIRGSSSISEIALATFFGRMVTFDLAVSKPGDIADVTCIDHFELIHGKIREGDAVFFHFGWDRFWDDPMPDSRFLKDWPGLSLAAAERLVERKVRIVGTDCLSIDAFGSSDFPAHRTLLGHGILVGENFARLGELPLFSFLVSLPLPVEGGSGSPLRAIASFKA